MRSTAIREEDTDWSRWLLGKPHLDNWIDCMRDPGRQPNGRIHSGFWHSVGTIMATRAYREGKKLYWDREKEEITDRATV